MSKKIGVLDVHQAAQSQPQTFVRKSAAQLLVRRLLAVWVVENALIQRVAVRAATEIPTGRGEYAPKHYIPDTLPPMETGGCVFQEPDNLVWQLRHAAASRSLKSKARLMRLALGYDKPKEVYA
jgi:hypothetical protein